jgi:hypothetical protein
MRKENRPLLQFRVGKTEEHVDKPQRPLRSFWEMLPEVEFEAEFASFQDQNRVGPFKEAIPISKVASSPRFP